MALDKLVDSAQLESDLTAVANAIRAKSGGSGTLAFPAGFVSEIGKIASGGETGSGEIAVGDFLVRHWETVTVGENSVAKGNELVTYLLGLAGLSSTPSLFRFVGLDKETVANGYVAAGGVGFAGTTELKGVRYRNGWNTFPLSAAYECSAFVGDKYLVLWDTVVT